MALRAGQCLQASCGFGLSRFKLPPLVQAAGGAASSSAGPDAAGASVPPAPEASSGRGPVARRGGRGRGAGKAPRKRAGARDGSSATFSPPSELQIAEAAARAADGNLPVFSLCIDQGSVGFSSTTFLLGGLFLVMVSMIDPPHRVWNDCTLAINSVPEMREARSLSKVLFNLNIGPFESRAWFLKIRESIEEFVSIARTTDPIFSALVEQIADDKGEADKLGDDGFQEALLASLPGMLSNQGGKVPQSRWFEFLRVARDHDRIWTARLVALLYYGLQEGFVSKHGAGGSKLSSKVLPAKTRGEPATHPTGSRDPSALTTFRSTCRNSLHVALLIYMDNHVKQCNRIMVTVFEPIRLWHGLHCQDNRSPLAGQRFLAEQATGEFFAALRGVVQKVSDSVALEFMGMSVLAKLSYGPVSDEDPIVLLGSESAGLVMRLVMSILCMRLRGMLPHTHGYPLCAAALLSTDHSEVARALEKMKLADEAWRVAQQKPQGAFWQNIIKQSFMHWTYNRILFSMARQSDFKEVTPAMRSFLEAWTMGVSTTKQTEDVFQRGRCDERSGQLHNQVTHQRRFATAIRSAVLTKVLWVAMQLGLRGGARGISGIIPQGSLAGEFSVHPSQGPSLASGGSPSHYFGKPASSATRAFASQYLWVFAPRAAQAQQPQ